MSDNNFLDKYSEKIKALNPNDDTAGADWDFVEKRLNDKDNKRRRIFLLIFLVSLLLVAIIGKYIIKPGDKAIEKVAIPTASIQKNEIQEHIQLSNEVFNPSLSNNEVDHLNENEENNISDISSEIKAKNNATTKNLANSNGPIAYYHDFGQKRLLHLYNDPDGAGPLEGGTVVPAQDISSLIDLQTHPLADTDVRLAHNALAGDPTVGAYNGHQNTPVFITRQLIQRLVTSNPSAGYVYRASNVYRSTNGNLGEVLKAILLDYEARSLNVADTIVSAGKLKEPLIQFASFLRALKPSTGAPLTTLRDMSVPYSGADSPLLSEFSKQVGAARRRAAKVRGRPHACTAHPSVCGRTAR